MDRSSSYLRILQSSAKFQRNICKILEYKANEAEKARRWVCNHLSSSAYQGHAHQVKETMMVNHQIIEIIDGLTQMENALAKNLEIALGPGQESQGLGIGGGESGGAMDFNLGGGMG